jgi:urease accessory protein
MRFLGKLLGQIAVLMLVTMSVAMAHSGGEGGSGFVSGLTHPLFGLDHVTAMVAVGIWGAFLGRPAIWILPVVFPLVMAFGGVLGIAGVPIPSIETGIAVSSVVLGLLIVFATKAPLWVAAIVVGAFAIFHGHAHGTELPGAVSPLAYSIGFVISTGLLHLAGILFGEVIRLPKGDWILRAGGGVIALAGIGFLTGAL